MIFHEVGRTLLDGLDKQVLGILEFHEVEDFAWSIAWGDLLGLWLNMSPASTYAKPFIKLPLDEADAGSLKITN